MRYFAFALLAFVAINAVYAQVVSDDYIYKVGNCTQKYNSTCVQDSSCSPMINQLYRCTVKNCFDSNTTQSQMPSCYKTNCATLVSNSTNSNITNFSDKIYDCLSSGITQFAFILLITIFSAIIVQY
ncbi:hypothetical protein ABPG74_019837 [Tetrahymena malaccensis]